MSLKLDRVWLIPSILDVSDMMRLNMLNMLVAFVWYWRRCRRPWGPGGQSEFQLERVRKHFVWFPHPVSANVTSPVPIQSLQTKLHCVHREATLPML